MLCALSLPTKTTASSYSIHWMTITQKLKWSFCVGICTDGAAAMIRQLFGLTSWIKEAAPEYESTHCVIHRKMLASQKMPPEFNRVLNDVVEVVNLITRP